MAYRAIPPANSGSSTWSRDRLLEIQLTAPTITNIVEFNCTNISSDFVIAAASGTAVTSAANDVPGGGIKWSTGTTNGSGQLLEPLGFGIATGAQRPALVDNLKTSPWAIITQVNITSAPASDTQTVLAAMMDTVAHNCDVWAAIIGADDTTHIELYINGAGLTKSVTNLVPSLGVWHNVGMIFDGTTLWAYLDGARSSTGITTLTNLPSAAGNFGRMYYYNGTTGADKVMRMSKCSVFTTGITIG